MSVVKFKRKPESVYTTEKNMTNTRTLVRVGTQVGFFYTLHVHLY